jgi:hypothetical protein
MNAWDITDTWGDQTTLQAKGLTGTLEVCGADDEWQATILHPTYSWEFGPDWDETVIGTYPTREAAIAAVARADAVVDARQRRQRALHAAALTEMHDDRG